MSCLAEIRSDVLGALSGEVTTFRSGRQIEVSHQLAIVMNSQWSNRATQIGEWYRNAALTTFSAIVLLLLLNLGLGVLYLARDTFSGEEPRVDSRVKDYRERHVDLEAYSKLSQDQANESVRLYLANMAMTQAFCQTYRIKCLFVWQPVPFYKYDAKLLRNPSSNIQPHWSRVFAGMSELRRDNFLYLGDMLENSSAKAYVDQAHYNERVNGEIAKAIYGFIRSNQKA